MESQKADEKLVLVLNCGSSSLKYEVFRMPHRESLGRGLVERIGEPVGRIEQSTPGGKFEHEQAIPDHRSAMELVAKHLADDHHGIIDDIRQIAGIGHRVVHGGEKYASSVVITDDVIETVEKCVELAPLHNPPNLTGIRAAKELLPDVPQVAVFDTAFHQTMPPAAYMYALPREFYDEYRIRRYGFHGTSHRYVSARAIGLMKRSPENTNVISAHLGNGASITAIESGRSVDTSMGFTPLEGLIMGTRSGDIDPAILFYLNDRGYTAKQLNTILNKKSGLLGLSGISNDLRDLEKASENGDQAATQALEAYAHRVRHYVGAYMATLVKVDLFVFTGGIGQHGWKMRERICHRLENIGIFMDYEMNRKMGSQEGIISHPYSPTTVMVVPTNEELQIALDVCDLVFPVAQEHSRRSTDVRV
ncbi:MAG TPA: acetate kinase [Candidatus Ozemobacteraceae bacterium]